MKNKLVDSKQGCMAIVSQRETRSLTMQVPTREPTIVEIRRALDEEVVLPLWPHVGRLLNKRRGATYSAAAKGEIKTIGVGKSKRVSTAWLRKVLSVDEPAA